MRNLTAELNKISECEMCSITAKQMAKGMVSLMTVFQHLKVNGISYHPWLSNTIFLPLYTTTIYEKTKFFKDMIT